MDILNAYKITIITIAIIVGILCASVLILVGQRVVESITESPEVKANRESLTVERMHANFVFAQTAKWGLLATGVICLVVFVSSNAFERVRKASVHLFKIGDSEFWVQQKDLGMAWGMSQALTSAKEIEAVSQAEAHEIYKDIAQTAGIMVRASHSRMLQANSQLALGDGNSINIEALPPTPTFQEVLHNRYGSLAIGFEHETKEARLADLEKDIVHLNIAGLSGGGKTTTIRFLLGQIVAFNFAQWIGLADDHPENDEGLTMSMGALTELPHVHTAKTQLVKDIISQFYTEMVARIDEKKPWAERWVLVCDEGLSLFKNIECLRDCLEKGTTQSRKFGMHLIFAAQTQKNTQIPTEYRDGFPSIMAHRMKRRQAQTFLQDGEQAKIVTGLVKGQAFYSDANGKEGVVDIPYTSLQDMETVARMVGNGSPVSVYDAEVWGELKTATPEAEEAENGMPELTPDSIREHREALELTQGELGKQIGISQREMSRVEQSKKDLTPELRQKLQRVFFPKLRPFKKRD